MSNDWIDDDSTSFEEKLEHFEQLEDVEITGPDSRGLWSLPGAKVMTPAAPNLGVVALEPIGLPVFAGNQSMPRSTSAMNGRSTTTPLATPATA